MEEYKIEQLLNSSLKNRRLTNLLFVQATRRSAAFHSRTILSLPPVTNIWELGWVASPCKLWQWPWNKRKFKLVNERNIAFCDLAPVAIYGIKTPLVISLLNKHTNKQRRFLINRNEISQNKTGPFLTTLLDTKLQK